MNKLRAFFGSVFVALLFTFAAGLPANAAIVNLTFTSATAKDNQGETFFPDPANFPELVITARGNIDPTRDTDPLAGPDPDDKNAIEGNVNTIVLGPRGMGVQEPLFKKKGGGLKDQSSNPGGSDGVSGKGREENEEVIFSFGSTSLLADSIVVGLNGIKINGDGSFVDEPWLYAETNTLGNYLIFDPTDIADIFLNLTQPITSGVLTGVEVSDSIGTFSFADLGTDINGNSFGSTDKVLSFALRNSNDEFYIAGFSGETSVVPLPAALPLFSAGLAAFGLAGWLKRRKTATLA